MACPCPNDRFLYDHPISYYLFGLIYALFTADFCHTFGTGFPTIKELDMFFYIVYFHSLIYYNMWYLRRRSSR